MTETTVTVSVAGEVTVATAAELRHALVEAILRQGVDRILVDLREATSLDPTAIGTLLAAAEAADDLRVDLAVCNPSPALAAQLTTTGFEHIRAA